LLVPHGPGKRTLHVPEELALQEVLREGAAVDGQEGSVAPGGEVVDVARHALLAGAALPLDQHGRVGGRNMLSQLEHFDEPLRFSDRPSDGDLTVCLYCGHLMVFGPNLSLRELTSDEMRDAAGNPEVLKAMMMIKDFNRMH